MHIDFSKKKQYCTIASYFKETKREIWALILDSFFNILTLNIFNGEA